MPLQLSSFPNFLCQYQLSASRQISQLWDSHDWGQCCSSQEEKLSPWKFIFSDTTCPNTVLHNTYLGHLFFNITQRKTIYIKTNKRNIPTSVSRLRVILSVYLYSIICTAWQNLSILSTYMNLTTWFPQKLPVGNTRKRKKLGRMCLCISKLVTQKLLWQYQVEQNSLTTCISLPHSKNTERQHLVENGYWT